MSQKSLLPCVLFTTIVAACNTPPPRTWLRYENAGATEWQKLGDGRFGGEVLGASVSIDLRDPGTRVRVEIENRGDGPLTVRLGPDVGRPDAAIGELLLRELDGPPEGGPEMVAYAAMQPRVLDAGWRGTFYLDRPNGREPKLGLYFVFAIELENAAGERVRRRLPVVAKMGGTVPAGAR